MTVGTSGNEGCRARVETAIAFSRVDLISGIAAGSDENITCTRPPATSVSAADAPLIAPGFCLASATRSFTLFTPAEGETTTTIAVDATIATAASSFSVSYV